MLNRLLAFPLAHWRGEIPLFPSLLLTLLGLRWLIASLGEMPCFALDAGLMLWQVVGSVRSMRRHLNDLPGFGAYVATLGSLIAAGVLMAYPYFPQSFGQPARLPPEPAGESGLSLSPKGARLSGPVSHDMYKALLAALEENAGLAGLTLSSTGGNIFAARGIARLVRENGLAVRVDETCASACTLIFIAADDRSLGAGGRLGFHGYRLTTPTPLFDPKEEEARDRAAMLARGLVPDFVDRVFQTDPGDIWFPSRAELLAAGVITDLGSAP